MEISGIDTVHSIKKAAPKGAVQTSHIEDSISISSEAKKRSEWVEMLKQMPDIRLDKVNSALTHQAPSITDLANKIAASGF